jgi:hypothetical protein
MYYINRVPLLTGDRELLKHVPPFRDVLTGNPETIANLSQLDLELIAVTTLSGMTVDEFILPATAAALLAAPTTALAQR